MKSTDKEESKGDSNEPSNGQKTRRDNIKRFRVSLDVAPDERWNEVIDECKQHLIQVQVFISDFIKENSGTIGVVLKVCILFSLIFFSYSHFALFCHLEMR